MTLTLGGRRGAPMADRSDWYAGVRPVRLSRTDTASCCREGYLDNMVMLPFGPSVDSDINPDIFRDALAYEPSLVWHAVRYSTSQRVRCLSLPPDG